MKKTQFIILAIILIVAASLGFATLTGGHNWSYSDFAGYILQAKSILAGDLDGFIAQNSITILESDVPVGPIAYPWGYPLLLAPIIAVMGISTLSMKILNILFFIIFLLSLYGIASKRLPQFESLALVAIFAFNPILIGSQDYILSDIVFLGLSTLTIFLIDHWDAAHQSKPTHLPQIIIGIAILVSFLTRTNGLLLLPTLIAYELFFAVKHRTLKASLSRWLIPTAVFAALWVLFSAIFPDGQSSHLEHYQDFKITQLWEFSLAYIHMGAAFFTQVPGAAIIYSIFRLFFIVGFLRKFQKNLLFSLYFFSTLLIYITWPHLQGVRFLYPILPFFMYISVQGMQDVATQLPEKFSKVFAIAYKGLFIFIAAAMLFTSAQAARQNLADGRSIHGPFDEVAIEIFDVVKNQTPEESRIIFFKPRIMTLMTGRDSILILSCENLPKADYVVTNKKWEDVGQIAPEEIESCPTPLSKLYENRRFVLYKIGD